MKIALLLLIGLPLVYSAALSGVEKRLAIGKVQIDQFIPQIAGLLNNTYSHSGCEKACHNVINAAGIVCDLLHVCTNYGESDNVINAAGIVCNLLHVCTKVEKYLHLPQGN